MNKYFLIKGNHTPGITSSHLSYYEVINSSNISIINISAKNIKLGIKNIPWIKGSSYTPYSQDNFDNSYVFYNQKVYLCLSNNDLNIKNITNSSTFAPTHNLGKITYPDGYTWLYLYSITSDVLGFLNSKTIPAPSNYMLSSILNSLETDNINCEEGITGICALYITDSTKENANLIYQQGISCGVCKEIAEETSKTDLLTTIFYKQGQEILSSIEIKSKQENINELIDSKKINPNLDFEFKTFNDAKLSGISNGCILSASIDLEQIRGVSLSYLFLSQNENNITVTGGIGASISFKTISENNKLKIIGINLLNGGKNYTTNTTEIFLPGITDTQKRDTIKNSIKLQKSTPSLVFNEINSIFDVASSNSLGKINSNKIINCQLDAYDPQVNYYGIIQADSNTEETIYKLCPSSLKVYPFSSIGVTSGTEYLNINLNEPISQTEINMR